ncbi:MAG: hypothetical protein IPF41_05980 [Flavobacteriales bacterium]|nr:hypothetical protein [Flavobacteriales bacterium]
MILRYIQAAVGLNALRFLGGNVKQVDYQKGKPDAFHHRYAYDADNRITEVQTSADAINWMRDARYFYYPHGPLQRAELGKLVVQGMDYAYTLQGWLKGINGNRLDPATDMGHDGDLADAETTNDLVGHDAFALSLGYYGDEDHAAIDPAWVSTPAGAPSQKWGPPARLLRSTSRSTTATSPTP